MSRFHFSWDNQYAVERNKLLLQRLGTRQQFIFLFADSKETNTDALRRILLRLAFVCPLGMQLVES